MKTKKTLIFIILIFAPLVFSQTLPPDFFRQYSKRSTSENGVNFAPYDYKHIGSGKFEGGGANRDSVIIYALRVEFRPDSVINTTGNGLFMRRNAETHQISTDSVLRIYDPKSPAGMRLSRTDRKEFEWYLNTYKYDKLPHDSTYIDEHLTALRNYYLEASNGNIKIGHEIFPSGTFGAFRLNNEIASYSPGNKRNNESNDDFGIRRSRALMRFVLEAVDSANNSQNNSPFKNLYMDENGRLFNENDIPVFILLFHAGSSGLTDGGTGGSGNADSPSDFQDIFVNEEWFKFFNSSSSQENNFAANIEKDSVSKKIGAKVTGKEGKAIYLSELMMVSETANQDSLNWGINGILVNQFARQIGVPDLYSTSSGTTGIGSFGIMDFAGYSAAQGFIPPNPSAFIRSYMGWSEPILANPEPDKKFALSVSKDKSKSNLYLVPINNSEYYLIENRQRNLTGNPNVFVYDTINGNQYISSGFQLNLEHCVNSVSSRGVILGVKSESRDIGIPASGVCVWHIDEKLIENRIKYNMLNSDSSYRAVSLKEADGVVDIGVEFTDMLGYPWYDYGNAGDVFPHRNNFLSTNKSTVANIMSPTTMPSTAANDGGNSYLKLSFENSDTSKKEIYYYSKSSKGDYESYSVTNYSDSVIYMFVSLENNNISPKFNVRIKGKDFYPLLTADVFRDINGKEIVALSKDGNLSIISEKGIIIYKEKIADEIKNMPSFIDNILYIPCKNKILIYKGEENDNIEKDSIIGFDVSSYLVGLDDNLWVFGTNDGNLVFGSGKKTVQNSVSLDNQAISAIAKFKEKTAIAVSEKGNVFIVSSDGKKSEKYELLNAKYAFFPFKIAVSNDRIIVCDNRQGLWFLTYSEENGKIIIKQNENQQEFPVDWAGIFREQSSRENIPENHGFLSMANLDESGDLQLLVGGTNGVYAFDEKGYLLENYPAILDRADWYIRKSVLATPASAKNKKGEHFIFFATTTGDEKSYYQTKITRPPDTVRGIIYFDDINGKPDSMSGFSKKYIIDTLLSHNDSMFLPYFAPGGLIDVRSGKTGKRPDLQIATQNTGKNRIFPYLISVGEPLSQGVVLDNLSDDKELDLIAVSDNGMLYRFGLPEFLADKTDMTGGNAARQFNFEKTQNSKKQADNILEYFYSYPNPVKISKGDKGAVTFRYELGNNASSALLTIYTIQGQKVFEEKNLRFSQGINEFVLNDLSRFGSAVYRCRLSVKFGGEEKVLFWKMAVLK